MNYVFNVVFYKFDWILWKMSTCVVLRWLLRVSPESFHRISKRSIRINKEINLWTINLFGVVSPENVGISDRSKVTRSKENRMMFSLRSRRPIVQIETRFEQVRQTRGRRKLVFACKKRMWSVETNRLVFSSTKREEILFRIEKNFFAVRFQMFDEILTSFSRSSS